MKKLLVLCLLIVLFAATIRLPSIDITGLFVKTSSIVVTIARQVLKQVLTVVIRVL